MVCRPDDRTPDTSDLYRALEGFVERHYLNSSQSSSSSSQVQSYVDYTVRRTCVNIGVLLHIGFLVEAFAAVMARERSSVAVDE